MEFPASSENASTQPRFEFSPQRRLQVDSETGPLRTVIIGLGDNFDIGAAEIINETQKKTYFGPEPPERETLTHQLNALAAVLERHGIEVLRPEPVAGIPDQMMVRDIGVTIGGQFLLTRMANDSRQQEWLGIQAVLDQMPRRQIVEVPAPLILEGGDVIVDRGLIFVGISQRTTMEGAAFLQKQFPEYHVVPVHLKQVDEGVDVLHLDCTFVPIGRRHALIYPGGFRKIPDVIRHRYHWVEVTAAEQSSLATNVLSISPDTIISRQSSRRINDTLSRLGFSVIPLQFYEPPKTGGSFRCCSLPLARDPIEN